MREGGRKADELPVADGGEGTADALLRALGGDWVEAEGRVARSAGRLTLLASHASAATPAHSLGPVFADTGGRSATSLFHYCAAVGTDYG